MPKIEAGWLGKRLPSDSQIFWLAVGFNKTFTSSNIFLSYPREAPTFVAGMVKERRRKIYLVNRFATKADQQQISLSFSQESLRRVFKFMKKNMTHLIIKSQTCREKRPGYTSSVNFPPYHLS